MRGGGSTFYVGLTIFSQPRKCSLWRVPRARATWASTSAFRSIIHRAGFSVLGVKSAWPYCIDDCLPEESIENLYIIALCTVCRISENKEGTSSRFGHDKVSSAVETAHEGGMEDKAAWRTLRPKPLRASVAMH